MRLSTFLKDFKEDEEGTASIELVLSVPILLWALLSVYVFFDAYRAQSINTRAGLTIADMISRENNPIDVNYLDNAQTLLDFLTESDGPPGLRVTQYEYVASSNAYEVVWAYDNGIGDPLTTATLANFTNQLPIMGDRRRAILVETKVDYDAPFLTSLSPFTGTGLTKLEFDSFTVISPRFRTFVCLDDGGTVDKCTFPRPVTP